MKPRSLQAWEDSVRQKMEEGDLLGLVHAIGMFPRSCNPTQLPTKWIGNFVRQVKEGKDLPTCARAALGGVQTVLVQRMMYMDPSDLPVLRSFVVGMTALCSIFTHLPNPPVEKGKLSSVLHQEPSQPTEWMVEKMLFFLKHDQHDLASVAWKECTHSTWGQRYWKTPRRMFDYSLPHVAGVRFQLMGHMIAQLVDTSPNSGINLSPLDGWAQHDPEIAQTLVEMFEHRHVMKEVFKTTRRQMSFSHTSQEIFMPMGFDGPVGEQSPLEILEERRGELVGFLGLPTVQAYIDKKALAKAVADKPQAPKKLM